MSDNLQHITKLDAARRQLSTAIELWFDDKDAVSIHTLASAAYEIIHVVSKKRGRTRDLIFDSIIVKEEHRREFNDALKKHANFFKHAHTDVNAKIEFNPRASEYLFLFTILGIELAGEKLNDVEIAFVWWLQIMRPDLLTENGANSLASLVPSENIQALRNAEKGVFFRAFLIARAQKI